MHKIRVIGVLALIALGAFGGMAFKASAVTVFPEGCGDCGPWKR